MKKLWKHFEMGTEFLLSTKTEAHDKIIFLLSAKKHTTK
jgi:hypothetical protein